MSRAHGHNGPIHASGLALGALVVAWPLATAFASDTNYRWVDEDGEVHYGDSLSPEQAKKKHEVIDDSGIVRDERNAEDNADEEDEGGAGASSEEAAQAQESEAAEDGADDGPEPRDDEMLLQAFPTEQMLIETRDRRLESLQSRIDLTRQNIERLASSYANRQERLSSLPEENDQRAEVKKQISELEQRMGEQRAHLSKLEAQKAELEAQFKADIERYRELKSDDDAE